MRGKAKSFKDKMREQMAARDRRIRELAQSGKWSLAEIGKRHAITRQRVYQIVRQA